MSHRIENDKINLDLWRCEENSQALDKLIHRYERGVFSFVLYVSSCDWNAAYEVTANCFTDVLTEMKSSAQEPLSVALFSRALNQCRQVKAVPLFNPVRFINAPDSRKKILETAREALMSLPFDRKSMLILRDQVNLSYEEIAQIMRIPLEEIKIKTWQARNNFRDKVEEMIDRDRGSRK